MADTKQSYLNGAYYGPNIPPQRTSRSVGRRGSGSSCCCLPCCILGTIFNCLFSIIITIIVILGIIVLALWLVFRPNEVKVYVEDATLTQFNLANATNNLQYNLTLDMSIRNPNKRIGLDFNYIEADAYYDGVRFGFTQLPTFDQGHKNTTDLHPAFQGAAVLVGDSVNATYTREKGEGYYNIDVKLYTRLKLKVWVFKVYKIKPEVKCTVKLPVPGGTNAAAAFERTKCYVRHF